MKEIKIHCTWEAVIPVEVPDDFHWDGTLAQLDKVEVLEAITPSDPSTELTDWYQTGSLA